MKILKLPSDAQTQAPGLSRERREQGPGPERRRVELIIAAVLVAGLLLTWTPRPWSRRSAAVVQSFGILGVLLGMATIALGIGPRTTLDLTLNVTLLLTLIAGLAITLRKPGPVLRDGLRAPTLINGPSASNRPWFLYNSPPPVPGTPEGVRDGGGSPSSLWTLMGAPLDYPAANIFKTVAAIHRAGLMYEANSEGIGAFEHGDARRAGLPTAAAAVAAVGFVLVAGYQVLLALGIAFSGAAWGGATLTSALRLASAVSAVVLILAALVALGRAGYWGSRLPFAIFRWGTWILVVGMLLSALANFASPTVGERFFLGPSAVLLALLCLAATALRCGSAPRRRKGGEQTLGSPFCIASRS